MRLVLLSQGNLQEQASEAPAAHRDWTVPVPAPKEARASAAAAEIQASGPEAGLSDLQKLFRLDLPALAELQKALALEKVQ